MGSENNRNCSFSVLTGLLRDEILPPSTTPTTDIAAVVGKGLPKFLQENELAANLTRPLKENTDICRSQKRKSSPNSGVDSKQMLKENIAEENLPVTPKDHIVPSDWKGKTPGAPSKNSNKSRVRRIGLEHMRQPDFSFCPSTVN